MKNLRLIPDIHRQQHIVKANFAFDKELIALVKKQTGVRWSQTLKCWYFSKADFNLNTFYKNFEGNAFLDHFYLKQQSKQIKKITRVVLKPTFKLPKGYLKQLDLKRYSFFSGRRRKKDRITLFSEHVTLLGLCYCNCFFSMSNNN